MKAYIVFGQQGEYSDYREWMVKGFFDEAKAKAFEDEIAKKAAEAERAITSLWSDFGKAWPWKAGQYALPEYGAAYKKTQDRQNELEAPAVAMDPQYSRWTGYDVREIEIE